MTHTTKHTPGPWVVHTFTISGKEKLEVLDATGTNACVQANAHLIAAAPAMYAALVEFLQCGPNAGHNQDLIVMVRAALAQAEGRDK